MFSRVKFKLMFGRVKMCVVVVYHSTEEDEVERERLLNDLNRVLGRVANTNE